MQGPAVWCPISSAVVSWPSQKNDGVAELATLKVHSGVEHDVGLAIVELAVLQLRRLLHLEVLDAPDLHASFLATVLPRGLVVAACSRGASFTSVPMHTQLELFRGTQSPSHFFSNTVQSDEHDRHRFDEESLDTWHFADDVPSD